MGTSPQTSESACLRPPRPLHRDQVDDLLRLEKAARKINSFLDLDQLIEHVVNDIAISFGCVEANIYLRDEHRDEMILAGVCGCTTGHKGQRLPIQPLAVGQGLARLDLVQPGAQLGVPRGKASVTVL